MRAPDRHTYAHAHDATAHAHDPHPVAHPDVRAVVSYSMGTDPVRTLIEHWDGIAWSVVPSPNVSGLDRTLTGVAAVSANDVWAVGYYHNANYVVQTLIEHWNGSAWSIVPSSNV